MNRYGEPQPAFLLELLANLYRTATDRLLITRGGMEGIDLLVRTFCRAGYDAVLTNTPTFEMYAISSCIQGARTYSLPLRSDDGFALDVDGILAAHQANPNIKLVFACTPNNPTGHLLSRSDLLLLSRELYGKALVVADQTYVEFASQPSLCSEIADHPNLVVLRSLSKAYGLAGERCGVTIADPRVVGLLRRVLAPYPLANSTVRAVARALCSDGLEDARAKINVVRQQREVLAAALAERRATIRVFPSEANFLLVKTRAPQLLVAVMERAGVRIRDRSNLEGLGGCVRIAIGTPDENQAMLTAFDRFSAQVSGDRADADPHPRSTRPAAASREEALTHA